MKKGFTLVELLIVMVVVSVLATLAVSKYKVAMEKGRGLEGLHNAAAISDALNAFYIQDGNVYNWERVPWALDAAATTKSKYFSCEIRDGNTNFQDVLCERTTGAYNLYFTNEEGETTKKICTGTQKYCKALGAIQSVKLESGETGWSF
ncbi:MAG: type II secretion system protein [Elusimicrobiaceae bacterium]|nr:type II secretion system protein [Elusimicrobiaceae bacterium]